jgi:hypothetical protein
MAYKLKTDKKKMIEYVGAKLENSYLLLEHKSLSEYGTSYIDLSEKEQKEIREKVAKDII